MRIACFSSISKGKVQSSGKALYSLNLNWSEAPHPTVRIPNIVS